MHPHAINDVSTTKKSFLFYIENIRAIAIIMVVLCHLSAWTRASTSAAPWVAFHLSDATGVFVFISGFLFKFLAEKKGFYFPSYIKKKFYNVFLPYLLFCLLATTLGLIFQRYDAVGLSALQYFIWSFIVGGSVVGPLWFIPMILLYFLSSKLWILLSTSRYIYIPVIVMVSISIFTSRPYGNANPLYSFIHFSGFYSLGIFMAARIEPMSKLIICHKKWLMPIIITLTFFYITVFFIYYGNNIYSQEGGFESNLFNVNLIQLGKVFFTLLIFLTSIRYLNRKIPLLSYMAEISFGLFFVHGFSLLMFTYITSRLYISNLLLYASLELLFAFGLSILFISTIKKFTGQWSRYVLGC